MTNLTCNYCKKRFKDLVLPFNIPVIYICSKCSQSKICKHEYLKILGQNIKKCKFCSIEKKLYTNTKRLKNAYNSYLAEKKRFPKNNVRLIWNNLTNDFDISIFFSDNSLINNFKSTIYL